MLKEEDAFRDDIHNENEVDVQVSPNGKVFLVNGKPIDIRQFLFDENNLLFSYDNKHNEDFFDMCKRLYRHKLRTVDRIPFTDVLDYLHIDLKQRNLKLKEMFFTKDTGFDFDVIPIEFFYDYPVEKEGYVLAFNIAY